VNEESIFAAAFEKAPGAERQTYLEEACGDNAALRQRIEDLLEAAASERGMLDNITAAVEMKNGNAARGSASAPSLALGSLIAGRYRLLELIGEGGMGEVFVAEQIEPVRRKVALKLIKPGFDSRAVLARFEKERQALAIMDHPHIAKIFDGGVTESGRPYFVMEYLKGSPITEYCDSVRMPIRERLQLFRAACDAVQHAHQKGVIHRDLKPSNILVALYDDKPVVKVIDFGLVKSVAPAPEDQTQVTGHAMLVGTPLYMSPEQAQQNNLDIDTRSDVYALGVVLYELLTGSTPIERERFKKTAWNEAMRMIREVDPPTPSTRISSTDALPSVAALRQLEPARLSKLVRGELDWIVMKSLEKERNRRYESASALEKDLGNYLQGEAVSASPPSKIYRLRKFARRNKVAIGTVALVFLSLSVGLAVAGYGLYQANASAGRERIAKDDALKQRNRAEERENDAIEAIKKFADAVAGNPALKNNPTLEPLRKELLQEPIDYFQSLRERLQASRDTRPEALMRLTSALLELGELTSEVGDRRDALATFQAAKEVIESVALKHPDNFQLQRLLASCYNYIGVQLHFVGRSNEAIVALQNAKAVCTRLSHADPLDLENRLQLASLLQNIAAELSETGEYRESLSAYQEAIHSLNYLLRTEPNNIEYQQLIAACEWGIGNLLRTLRRTEDALSAFQKAIDILAPLAQTHPTNTEVWSPLAASYHGLGSSYCDLEKQAIALVEFEKSLAIWQRLAREHPSTTKYQIQLANIHQSIGVTNRATGNYTAAHSAFENAKTILDHFVRNNFGSLPIQFDLAVTYMEIGATFAAAGQPVEAMVHFTKAKELHEKVVKANPTNTRFQTEFENTLTQIGAQFTTTGKFPDAIAILEKSRQISVQLVEAHPTVSVFQEDLARCHTNLGTVYRKAKMHKDALRAVQLARDLRITLIKTNASSKQTKIALAMNHSDIADTFAEMNQLNEAVAELTLARNIWQELLLEEPDSLVYLSKLSAVHGTIGFFMAQAGRFDESLAEFKLAKSIDEKLVVSNPTNAEFINGLARSLSNMAKAEMELGRAEQSLGLARQAIGKGKQSLAIEPTNSSYRDQLKKAIINLNDAAKAVNNSDAAAEAENEWKDFLRSDPKLAALDPRIEEVAKGTKEVTPEELVMLAQRAYDTRRFALAAKFWSDAIQRDSLLAEDRSFQHGYNAACSAALANGVGSDASNLDDEDKSKLRAQSHMYLTGEFENWTKRLLTGKADDCALIVDTMKFWQKDTDLDSLRGDHLEKLPEAERQQWQVLWKRVAELEQKAFEASSKSSP
jgi:serine/threonine protein kinase/tetratricopeptide (TPR) repeat protein